MKRLVWLPLLVILLAGCSGGAEAVIRADGSAEISLDFALTSEAANLLRGLDAVFRQGETPQGGTPPGGLPPLIDGQAIARSLAAAPGVSRAALRNRDGASVEGGVSLSRIGAFLAPPSGAGSSPVSWDENGALSLSLSRETAPAFLLRLSEEVSTYLSAIMAPCATGEALSKAEYLALVTSIYGRPLADEIASTRLRLSLTVPGAVVSATGGTASGNAGSSFRGNRAEFTIPLIDLLVLERPLAYQVRWNWR